MKSLLLILILFGDPASQALADGVAEDLRRVGGEHARVLVGAEATAELDRRGIKIQDLVAAPNIAQHLTKGDANLAVVSLGREVSGGDVVVETRLWFEGRDDRHVAIAGNGGDPQGSVANGLVRALAHRLPNARAAAPVADETQLAGLADRQEWAQMLGQLAGIEQPSPRQRYYEVLAYSRLGQRDAAVAALNEMRTAHPDHFLIKAAEEVLPAEAGETMEEPGAEAAGTGEPEAAPEPVVPAPVAPTDGDTLR